MRRFIELADHIRNHGVDAFRSDTLEAVKGKGNARMTSALEECRVFVFSPNEVIPKDLDTDSFVHPTNAVLAAKDRSALFGPTLETNLDAPFKVFSIEVAGDAPMGIYENRDKSGESTGEMVNQYCIMVCELAPKMYGCYSLEQFGDYRRVFASNGEIETIKFYLNRLARERTGLEHVRSKVKIGEGKEKRLHRISEVIHVRPKSEAIGGSGTRDIDWSHRFEVRGHWRKCDGIGKDRAGIYCVNGFTWVTEHVRGPEHLPLIKKTRLVDN